MICGFIQEGTIIIGIDIITDTIGTHGTTHHIETIHLTLDIQEVEGQLQTPLPHELLEQTEQIEHYQQELHELEE